MPFDNFKLTKPLADFMQKESMTPAQIRKVLND